MERTLFEKSTVILTHRQTGLFVIGPQDVHAHIQGKTQTVQPDPEVKPQAPVADDQAPQQEQDLLTPAERRALAATEAKHAAPGDGDRNMGTASVQQRQRAEWVQAILGKELGKALDGANQAKNINATQVADRLYQGNRQQVHEVIGRLEAAKSALPANAVEDIKFLDEVIKNLKAHAALDGNTQGRQMGASSAAAATGNEPRPLTAAQRNQLAGLERLANQLFTKLPLNLASLNSKDPQVLLARVREHFAPRINDLTNRLRDAQAKLDLLPPQSARRAVLSRDIENLRKEIDALQGEQADAEQQVRIVTKFAAKLAEIKSSGDPEAFNDFVNALEVEQPGLGSTLLAALQSLDDADLDQLEAAFDDIFSEIETDTAERSSDTAETEGPESQMGTSSAHQTTQSNLDEPVEAVEAVEAVDSDTEIGDAGEGVEGFGGGMGAQSAGADETVHNEIKEDWSNLTQSQMAEQMATAGVKMGITSSYYSARSEERKLKKQIDQVIQAVQRGNNDAITLALILLGRKSQESLRRAGLTVLNAMKHYEAQQGALNKSLGQLTGEEKDYASRLQGLSSEMNKFASNRQAAVSILREIKSASDTMENFTKSWLDIQGPFQRALARFTA